jgi:hypothetical protein
MYLTDLTKDNFNFSSRLDFPFRLRWHSRTYFVIWVGKLTIDR